jgi:hypothetical protein
MIKTMYGTWVNATTFIEHTGEEHRLCTYQMTLDAVRERFPFVCFIQVDRGIIKNYVEADG